MRPMNKKDQRQLENLKVYLRESIDNFLDNNNESVRILVVIHALTDTINDTLDATISFK